MKTMKQIFSVLLAAALCFCAVGCTLLSPDDVRPQPEPQPQSPFDAVIAAYETAVAQGLDEAGMTAQGLNYMLPMCLAQDERAQVGYYVGDLNGDGQEELAIAAKSESEYYTGLIFTLYILQDGQALPLVESGERDRWYYAGEGQLYNVAAASAMGTQNCLCTMDGNLSYIDGVTYDAVEHPDAPWLHFTGDTWEAVTEQEAAALILDMEANVVNLDIIPFPQ